MICLKVSYETVRQGKEYIRKVVDKNVIRNIHSAKISGTLNLPYKELDLDLDKRWNAKKINAEMLQALEKGESIKEMSERLQRVTDMNKVSAVRNARTMTTSFENLGRLDGMKKMQENGTIVKKKWLATNDSKTRDAHAQLNGVTANVDESFKNDLGEIMYPGDPSASAANIYNCRCTLTYEIEGFEPSKNYEVYVYDIGEKARIKYIDKETELKRIETVNSEIIELDKPLKYGLLDKNISDEAREKLEKFEYKYLTKGGGIEHEMSITKEGKEKFLSGEKNRVSYINGDIVTHIHPRREGVLGGTFSKADIKTFINYRETKTMRAVAKEGTYSITKLPYFDPRRNFADDYSEASSIAYLRYIDPNDVFIAKHKWLLKNQDKYGYFYTLERRKI